MTFYHSLSFFRGGGIWMFFFLRDKSYQEFVRQVFPDSKDPQWILKADPMDLSLPSLGRRYKFCLYNSYFLVQDSLWIQLALPDSPALPCIALRTFSPPFYKGKSVNFYFKLYTGALTGVWTGAVSLSLSMDYTATSVSHHATLPFLGELYLFWSYFKITNLCACRCQCLQSPPIENFLPGQYSSISKSPAGYQWYSLSGDLGFLTSGT